MAYLGNSPGVASQRIVTTFTATAGQTTFTPSSGYALGYCDVFQNGVKLVAGDDYTASNGTTVVLATGANAGDSVEVVAFIPRGLSDGYLKAEADARFPRVDTASQGLNSTQQSNARANIGAQAALGYTPVNKAGDTMTGRLTIQKSSDDRTIHVETSGGYGAVTFSGGTNTTFFGHSEGVGHFNVNAVAGDACIRAQNGVSIAANGGNNGIRLDSAGRVRMPFQPAFVAALVDNWTHPSGVVGHVGSDATWAASTNIGNCFSTATRRFVAPIAGVYLFNCTIGTTGSAGGFSYLSAELWVNGARTQVGGWGTGGASGSYGQTSNSFIVYMNAGDYATLGCEASKTFVVQGGSGQTQISGHLIG